MTNYRLITCGLVLFSSALYAQDSKKDCNPGPGSRGSIGYRAPKGFGYDEGYTTLSTFLSPSGERPFQPFIDLRGHVFNDGRWAANAGLGGRYACENAIVGLNAYYDFRDTKELGSQNQVGGGFELLSKWADLRINGYVPVGNTTGEECPCFDHFACHSAIARQVVRASLADIDAEVGFYAPKLKYVDLYFAAGPYYLFEKNVAGENLGGVWGGRGRVSLKVYDGITIGGDVTYDPIFNTKGQGWITLSFPFGPANMVQNSTRFDSKYPAPCDETARQFARMTQPVYRNEIIPVENKTHLFDLCCDLPCSPRIYFVNNRNCLPGSGTFENPFNNLLFAEGTAKEGDIIYVLPGDGTSRNMDCGFIMKECQRLIGSAASFDLCDICIPACTPGCFPLIQNFTRIGDVQAPAGFEVLMNDCTEVAGLHLDGANTTFDPSIGIIINLGNNYTIRNNLFTNHIGAAIVRTNPLESGHIKIENNCIKNVMRTATFNDARAIGIFNTITNSSLSFCNNMISDISSSIDSAQGIVFGDTISNTNFSFCNNSLQNFNGVGNVNATAFSSLTNCTVSFRGNSFQNFSSDNGIFAIGFGEPVANSSLCFSCNSMQNFSAQANILGILLTNPSNTEFYACNNTFDNFISSQSSTAGIVLFASNDDINFSSLNNTFQNFSGINSATFGINMLGSYNNSNLVFCNNTFQNLKNTTHNVAGVQLNGTYENGSLAFCNNSFKDFSSTNGVNGITLDGAFANNPVAFSNNCFENLTATAAGTTTSGILLLNSFTESPITVCNNSFQNITSSQDAAGFYSQANLFSTPVSICNNSFNDIQGTVVSLDVSIRSQVDQSTLCIENNQLFVNVDIESFGGTSCLRLFGNQSSGQYNIQQGGNVINVESPDLSNLTAGLESINTGTVNTANGTAVPLGTCDCTSCCCK